MPTTIARISATVTFSEVKNFEYPTGAALAHLVATALTEVVDGVDAGAAVVVVVDARVDVEALLDELEHATRTAQPSATASGHGQARRLNRMSPVAMCAECARPRLMSSAQNGSSALLWLPRVQLHVAGAGLRCDRN